MKSMSPDRFEEIEKKLGAAWKFLTGEERCFRFFEATALRDVQGIDRRIVLPMSISHTDHLAATALLIEREDAEQLASSMFDVARTDLSEADIADACAEACNVLSTAMVEYLSGEESVDIGLPRLMEAGRYRRVSSASGIKAYSEGTSDHHQLTLVVFDPLKEPMSREGE